MKPIALLVPEEFNFTTATTNCYVTFDQYNEWVCSNFRGVVSVEGRDLAFSQLFERRSHSLNEKLTLLTKISVVGYLKAICTCKKSCNKQA